MKKLWQRLLLPAALGLATTSGIVLGGAAPASAATTITLNPATVAGTDFTWTCVVNAGDGNVYVSGASWIAVGGTDFVETPRVMVTGTANTTLTFHRDGSPNQTYQYRCKAYPAAAGGSPILLSTKLEVTTYGDTRYSVLVSTHNEPGLSDDLPSYVISYNDHRALMGDHPLGVRVYSSGSIPLATDASYPGEVMNWIATNHPDESITVSFKAYDSTRLTALLDWAQVNDIALTVVYYHEPQDNWAKGQDPAAAPTVYKNIYNQMRSVINGHPRAAHIILEKNLMWYWQYFQAATKGADWQDYIEVKDTTGARVDPADRVTWDAYNPLGWTRYATPAEFMQFALAVWQEAGVGWGYGEIGAVPIGTADAAWVAAIKAYADAARTPTLAGTAYAGLPAGQTFKYWCGYHNNGADSYHLEQNPDAASTYRNYLTTMPLIG
jgi:hypothetical protein